jgi:hypothetical protein
MQYKNYPRPFELAKKIEDYILWKLACDHLDARDSGEPEQDVHEKRVDIYNWFMQCAELERETKKGVPEYQTLTAGFFNRVVDDMKKAGLIGTAKGGSILYLTEASRKEWVDSGKIKPFPALPKTEVRP